MGWVMAPATMLPTAPITRLATLGRIACARGADPEENAAEMTVKGSRRTDEATSTMIPASSRMPNTRQKLLRTSRHERPSAWAGPCRSSTTAAADMLNIVQNQTSSTSEAMAPRKPAAMSSPPGAPATPSAISTAASPAQGPMRARPVSSVASSRAGSRGSAMRQASPAVIRSPSTLRPTTAVSRPVSRIWTMNARTRAVRPLGMTTASMPASCAPVSVWSVPVFSPSWDRRRTSRLVVMIAEMVSTTAAMPRVAFGLRRMDVNAPSRISPTAIGRSGMTPGLGACGGAAHPPGGAP